MATVFVVPSVITQFSYVKRLVDEEAFQVQNETKLSSNTSMFESDKEVEGCLLICRWGQPMEGEHVTCRGATPLLCEPSLGD